MSDKPLFFSKFPYPRDIMNRNYEVWKKANITEIARENLPKTCVKK
jgi:hypothetical protein